MEEIRKKRSSKEEVNSSFGTNAKFSLWSKTQLAEDKGKEMCVFSQIGNADFCNGLVKDTFWITYRKEIAWMDGPTTDNLWGCMMRVTQMLVAQCLKMHRRFQGISCSDKDLVYAFDDDDKDSVYSSRRILTGENAVHLGLQLGKWNTTTQMAKQLSFLHHNQPLKGFERLKILEHERAVNFTDIVYEMGFKLCKSHNEIRCDECKNFLNFERFHIAVIVLGQLAKDREAIPWLMRSQLFAGMTGGATDYAHYYIGYQQEKSNPSDTNLIYLDPHYVQKQEQLKDFQCPYVLTESIGKVNESIGMCFYLRNSQDIVQLKELLERASQLFGQSMPFGSQVHKKSQSHVKEIKDSAVSESTFQSEIGSEKSWSSINVTQSFVEIKNSTVGCIAIEDDPVYCLHNMQKRR